MPARRRKSTWKDVSKKRTFTHRLKLAGLACCGILVSAAFFGGLSFLQFLKAPLSLASGSFPEGRVWDNTSPLNLALIVTDDLGSTIKSLGLLTADKYQNSVSIVALPADAIVPYPLGLGDAALSQALILGDSLTPRIGVGMVEKVLKKALAVPIDRYVLIKESDLAKFGGNPAEFKELLRIKNLPKMWENAQFVRDYVVTNLNLGEMADLALFLRGVPATQIYSHDYTSAANLADIDGWWSEFYARGYLRQTRVPVLILNGTNREGLGSWGGRLVNNLGGDTLTVTNAYGAYAKTFIIADDPSLPAVAALGRVLSSAPISPSGQGSVRGETASNRAKVTLVLGLDSASVL